MIALNRRRIMGGAKLPYDAQIEYLESTGTQYIDTGIYMESNMIITCDYSFSDTSPRWSRLFGASIQNGTIGRVVYGNNTQTQICPRFLYPIEYRLATYTAGRYVVTIDDEHSIIKVAGTNYDQQATVEKWGPNEGLGSFFLWNFGGVNLVDFGRAKIYSFKIEKGGTAVIDFIPVRVGNVGYMYDRVSKQLFGNSGTGNFILGGDI